MLTVDPLRSCLACGPLALYLLALGALNVRRRPWVVSGGRDLAALGIGVSGLMVIGPVELLMPYAAAYNFGPFIWCVLATLYSLTLSLVALLARPRLVVYNACALAELRVVLSNVLPRLDSHARWAGNCVSLPTLQIDLSVEYHGLLRSIVLTATHDQQNLEAWSTLHAALNAEFAALEPTIPRRNPWGPLLAAFACVLIGYVGWQLVARPEQVVQELGDMLRW